MALSLALVTGFSALGATAATVAPASAVERLCESVPEGCPPIVADQLQDLADPAQPSTPGTGENAVGGGGAGAPPVVAEPPALPAAPVPVPAPAPVPAAPAPAAPAPVAPPAQAAPPAAAAPAAGSASSGAAARGSAGSSSGGDVSSSPAGVSSSSPDASAAAPAAAAAAPAVPVAPQGPMLTNLEQRAANRALEEARETLPTAVEPNTRLLAGNASSRGSLIPSADDSGLLALIVGMSLASLGCAVTAGALRHRSRPRHLAR
ncbi:hypothetical protein [Naasia sp. SYSU D00948]|uniref:hypothetical protein n=1 Tax=Naasia sp. SYSU D00948 TaxID=2817379 RepID=UPI001B31748F|nr:hypothetical protein [Naasia sp. SYSU D00948]